MSTASSGESILRFDCPRAHLASSIFPLRRLLWKILHIYEQLTQIVAAFQSIVSVIGAEHVADSDLPDITVCIHGKPTNSSWSQHKAFSPMHRGLKPLSIRSGANDLLKPRFSCSSSFYQVLAIRAWTQKKELADMNSISQHTNPGRSQLRMQQDRGWLAKPKALRLFCD